MVRNTLVLAQLATFLSLAGVLAYQGNIRLAAAQALLGAVTVLVYAS